MFDLVSVATSVSWPILGKDQPPSQPSDPARMAVRSQARGNSFLTFLIHQGDAGPLSSHPCNSSPHPPRQCIVTHPPTVDRSSPTIVAQGMLHRNTPAARRYNITASAARRCYITAPTARRCFIATPTAPAMLHHSHSTNGPTMLHCNTYGPDDAPLQHRRCYITTPAARALGDAPWQHRRAPGCSTAARLKHKQSAVRPPLR